MLATTTSVENTGLLDMLITEFETQYDYEVKVMALGTGAAIQRGYDGEADAVLVHAPELEMEFVDAGYGINRTTLWYNYFTVIGPLDDPANVSGASSAAEAFERIYNAAENGTFEFYSRGDNSGTHIKELSIWENGSLSPFGKVWYKEVAGGMSSTIVVCNENIGYTLSDLGTYTQMEGASEDFQLTSLFSSGEILYNPYSYMIVSLEKYDGLNYEGATTFLNFLLHPDTIEMVQNFKMGDTVLFNPIQP